MDRNREAFDADKQLIAERFALDYLLVDCKPPTGRSAIILLSCCPERDPIAYFSRRISRTSNTPVAPPKP